MILIIGRESCSRAQSVGERSAALKLGKAKARAAASRQLGSASLRKTESGQPAENGEASTGLEVSTTSTERTLRGGRRQRALKESPGTWETRFGVLREQPLTGSHNWFDHLFQRADGPAQWAKAKLARYADDFVVLARYISPQLRGWIEGKLEGWLGLQINREKTRVLDMRQAGQSLDFLGYTFRYDRDPYGPGNRHYLNLQPSRQAMAREREALRRLINPQQCHTPLPELIGRLNRHLRGWANYLGLAAL